MNWFSFYQLRSYLKDRGFESFDRFDVMRLDNKSAKAQMLVRTLRSSALLRRIGHVLTPETVVVAQLRR